MSHFDALKIYSCGNNVRKGEITCYMQFLLFSSAICFKLDQSKILSSGNRLRGSNWNAFKDFTLYHKRQMSLP